MAPTPTESAEGMGCLPPVDRVIQRKTIATTASFDKNDNVTEEKYRKETVNSSFTSSAWGSTTTTITTTKRAPLNDLSGIDKDGFVHEYEKEYEPPTFTIKELRDCIPAHLFQKSLMTSLVYVFGNLIVCGVLLYGATFIDSHLPHPLNWLAWPVYWWFQGVFATGVWVLAHECGHQAFSDSKTVNNFMGLILHSALLVPYHPWRISHAQHHASTAHMAKDQVFLPKRRSYVRPADQESPWKEAIESTPLYTWVLLAGYLTFGWPLYLFYHRSGPKYGRFTCHFLPSSPIFEARHRSQVIISDLALLVTVTALGYWIYNTSFLTVAKYYGIPYLCVNAWLVTITLLQHTDVYLPHYTPNTWNFVRGALSTVDRDYGWFLNHALHHIQDSHVAHHLFSQMPHYNAIKATPYLKEKLGEYYLYDRTPLWKALYRALHNCVFVEDTGDVLFYRNN